MILAVFFHQMSFSNQIQTQTPKQQQDKILNQSSIPVKKIDSRNEHISLSDNNSLKNGIRKDLRLENTAQFPSTTKPGAMNLNSEEKRTSDERTQLKS